MAQQTQNKTQGKGKGKAQSQNKAYTGNEKACVYQGKTYTLQDVIDRTPLTTYETVATIEETALQGLLAQADQAEKANKTSSTSREKKSELLKFQEKAQGKVADATRRAIREQFFTGISELSKENRNDTQKHMDGYTPKIISVLYDMDLLADDFKQQIESMLNS